MWFSKKNEEENNKPRIVRDPQNILKCLLYEKYKEAVVIDCFSHGKEIIIPRLIKESKLRFFFVKEYFITTLCKKSFESSLIKTIRFPIDSLVEKIEKSAFSNSEITRIYFPSSLLTLSDGWCKNTEYLIDVQIDPKNDFYSMQNDLLIGVSDIDAINGTKDKLFFANRNIKKAVIPSDIKYISPFAFENCTELETVEFEQPRNILSIGKYAFKNCRSLKKFSLPENIEKIEKFTFSESFESIESFEFDNYSHLKIIGKGAFMKSQIHKIDIPRSVKKIGKFAFRCCNLLRRIEINDYYDLETIGTKAFCDTQIERLSIPNNFKKFKDGWCDLTSNLNRLIVYKNDRYSEYQNFIIGKSDEKSDVFDTLVFAQRDIKSVVIPSFIKFISPYAFQYCEEIKHFEIQSNSELKIIGERAFANSSIDKLVLPSCAVKVGEDAFNSCDKLKYFEIGNNSQCQVIEEGAFRYSSIVCFTLPSSLTEIGKSIFNYCESLEIVEVDENINSKSIELSELINIVNTIIMVPVKLKNIVH